MKSKEKSLRCPILNLNCIFFYDSGNIHKIQAIFTYSCDSNTTKWCVPSLLFFSCSVLEKSVISRIVPELTWFYVALEWWNKDLEPGLAKTGQWVTFYFQRSLTWFFISLEAENQTHIGVVLKFLLALGECHGHDKGPYLLHALTFEFVIWVEQYIQWPFCSLCSVFCTREEMITHAYALLQG